MAAATATVADLLAQARLAVPLAEARLLLQHCLAASHAQLAAHPQRRPDAESAARFRQWVERRIAGEPVAYIVGRREFYGLDFQVGPAVLIPRPETELLVDLALERLRGRSRPRVLDLGTGSGCVAVALARDRPDADVWATDASLAALALARANARDLGVRLRLVESDWFAQLAGQRFDLIVSNPPYVCADDSHLQQGDLRFEPMTALASGGDGLDAIRRIVSQAPCHLAAHGALLFEHGYDQAQRCRELLLAQGFRQVSSWRDLAGIERVSGGQAPE